MEELSSVPHTDAEPPDYRWQVELTGAPTADLQFLISRFNRPGVRVGKHEDSFWLVADDFDPLEDPKEVRTKATELVRIALGIARFHYVSLCKPTVGKIIQYLPDGRACLYPPPVVFPSRRSHLARQGHHVDPMGNVCDSPQLPSAKELLDLIAHDDSVRDALLHYSHVEEWWSLYKIYEVILRDFKNQDSLLVSSGLVDEENALRNFKRTANDYRTGFTARHAVRLRGSLPPDKRLSLEDGVFFIGEMLRRWIAMRMSRG